MVCLSTAVAGWWLQTGVSQAQAEEVRIYDHPVLLGTHFNGTSDRASRSIHNLGDEAVNVRVETGGPLRVQHDCPPVLEPGDHCWVNVWAEVAAAGSYTGQILIEVNGQHRTIDVSGEAREVSLLIEWELDGETRRTTTAQSFRDPGFRALFADGSRHLIRVQNDFADYVLEGGPIVAGVLNGDVQEGLGTSVSVATSDARGCRGVSSTRIDTVQFDEDDEILELAATSEIQCEDGGRATAVIRIGPGAAANTLLNDTQLIDGVIGVNRTMRAQALISNPTNEPQAIDRVHWVEGSTSAPTEVTLDSSACPELLAPGERCAIGFSARVPAERFRYQREVNGYIAVRPTQGRDVLVEVELDVEQPRPRVDYLEGSLLTFFPSGYLTDWYEVQLTARGRLSFTLGDIEARDRDVTVFFLPDCIGVEIRPGQTCTFWMTFIGTTTSRRTPFLTMVDIHGVDAGYLAAPAVGGGYAIARSNGELSIFGGTQGITSFDLPPEERLAGTAFTPDAAGLWGVTEQGSVVVVGSARHLGDVAEMNLNAPVLNIIPTPSGRGYWLLAKDGGVFSFGDATFHGSTGDMVLNRPVVDMAPTASGGGYWLVAEDGGVFAFGDAEFHGSTGHLKLNKPIAGMDATADGAGYYMVAVDGGIFAFGSAPFHGSLGSTPPPHDVVDMALTPTGRGYWLATAGGAVHGFGDGEWFEDRRYANHADFVSLASLTLYSAAQAQRADQHRGTPTAMEGRIVFVAGETGLAGLRSR